MIWSPNYPYTVKTFDEATIKHDDIRKTTKRRRHGVGTLGK